MTTSTTSAPVRPAPQDMPAAARRVLSLLQRLQHGTLHVQWPDGSVAQYGATPASGPALNATLHLHSYAPLTQALKSGDIGFAESYIAGEWTTNNLSELLQLLVANRRDMDELIFGSWLGRLFYRVRHLLHRNTRSNSKKNIHAHYDLGNAFYELWLDPTMNYSSAWFDNDRAKPMAEAQTAKVRRALRMVDAKAGDRILEIGCGWGGVMEEALRSDIAITGLTLSTEQKAFADMRLNNIQASNGNAPAFEVRLQDYRDCQEQFDGIVSVEMFEAVGEKHWPEYFQTIAQRLKAGRKACIQTIVIAEELFDRYRTNTDFIQQYVFPGGMLPSRTSFRASAAQAGLKVEAEFAFGADYAKTLCIWRDSFNQKLQEVRQLGFDEAFIRLWNFYLMYCSAGFSERNIDVVQFTLSHEAPTPSVDALSA